MDKRHKKRRGAVMIVILACFALAATLFVLLGRMAMAERRASELQLWTVQAQWLAEAGLERAAARLRADAEYGGETWNISAAELGGDKAAKVEIRVESADDDESSDKLLIFVTADYPNDPVHRCRWKKQLEITLETPSAEAAEKGEK
jgi:Tfp pilus assembly protein PilX